MTQNISVYDFTNYKQYLAKKIQSDAAKTKGLKNKIAEHIGCQPSYLSQVLNGKPHFTLEQALRLSQFLAHQKHESKYFSILIQYARAGTEDLRQFFREQLIELRESRFDLKKRLESSTGVPLEMQHIYYSTWYYAAIHVMLSIPEKQDPHVISQSLHLPLEIVLEAIEFLEEAGLITKTKSGFEFTQRRLHLEGNSTFIQRHHINWRSQALQSVEKNLQTDLHYSNVVAIAEDDFQKIKEQFITAIEKARAIIKPSPEEALYVMTVDVFAL